MPNSRYAVERKHAYILDQEKIEKIGALLSSRIGELNISTKCKDGVERSFNSIKDLLAYENPKPKAILRLSISAREYGNHKNLSVGFSNLKYIGITIEINARDDVLSRLKNDIEDIIVGTRPWWDCLHKIDFVLISIFALIFFIITIHKWISLQPHNDPPPIESPSIFHVIEMLTLSSLAVAIIAILFIGSGIILNRLRDRVFPFSVFKIGQGKDIFGTTEKIQWGVVISTVLSVAVSIALTFLFN